MNCTCAEWQGREAYDCNRDGARMKQGVCNCACHKPISTPTEVRQPTVEEMSYPRGKDFRGVDIYTASTPTEGSMEVVLAPEGTPLAVFQIERTNAISEMFENRYADGVYPTSRFFARLDKCVAELLTQEKERSYLQGRNDAGESIAREIEGLVFHPPMGEEYVYNNVYEEAQKIAAATARSPKP